MMPTVAVALRMLPELRKNSYRHTWSFLTALLCVICLVFPAAGPVAARPLQAPVATASLDLPDETMLGEDFDFAVTFDNASADTGYGPYLDLFLPLSGIDGIPAPGNDGIQLASATYLGAAVQTTTLNCNSGTNVSHPLTGLMVACPAAPTVYSGPLPFTWQLNVLRLPFGSFVSSQPPVEVAIHVHMSNLADVGVPLTIQARAGFQYGADPLDNPSGDPPVNGGLVSAQTTPTLLSLSKEYNGPEDETATGSNYPRRYTLVVNIASGQTVTNLDVIDLLPNNLQYLQFISATPASCTHPEEPATGAPQNPPANRLLVNCASVTGTTGNRDVAVVFEYFVPLNDANGAPVINAANGDDVQSIDDARAEGDWTPVDSRDSAAHPVSDITPNDHVLTDKSIAIQKSVANLDVTSDPLDTSRPGNRLQYTLNFQVSDYFAFDGLAIHDVISDGQRFDPTFAPTLQINGNTYILPTAAFDPANFAVTPNYTPDSPAPNDGTTALDFDISAEIIQRGGNPAGQMVGGCIPVAGTDGPAPDCSGYNDGATTGTLVFRTRIQDQFSDDYAPNTPSVDQGDELENSVSISGNVLKVSDLSRTGPTEADDSGAQVSILRGQIAKSIYAINGVTAYPNPVRIAVGDTVTYRVQYDLPTSDVERLSVTDYLPLPIFDADEITPPFSATLSAAPPVAGSAKFGPADTFYDYSGLAPALTVDSATNSLRFFYGDYDDSRNQATRIDLLFTITVRNDPFADGLYLTNQARAHEGATGTGDVDTDSIIQLQLTEPVLHIRKGVVAANPAGTFNPTGALPGGVTISAPGSSCSRLTGTVNSTNLGATFNSNLTGVDASDLVTFAILIENTGSGLTGAFDVRLRDTLPTGFRIPTTPAGLNLCVTDGTGALLSYASLGGGLFDASGGIELIDTGGHGALVASNPTSGQNIAILLYDLQIDPTSTAVIPNANLDNTATLYNFAGSEGGPDHTYTDLTDTARVTIRPPSAAKILEATQINNARNSSTQVVIGETIDYRLTLTLPEGYLPNLRVVDTLDTGLAYVSCTSVTPSAGLSTSLAGGFAAACSPGITSSGRISTFNLGNVTNSNADNALAETIVIVYRAVMLNTSANQSGQQRNNSAVFSWTGGSLGAVSAPNVAVIEPQLAVAKTVTVNGSGTSGDAGDPVQYTITITQPAASQTDAFDLTFSDPLPRLPGGSLIDNPTFTVTDSAGAVSAGNFEMAGSNATNWTLQTLPGTSFNWPFNTTRQIVITINGTLSTLVDSGQTIPNTATLQWTSLDGSPGSISTYNANSTERTGAGGVNDYAADASASINIIAPRMQKQAVGTSLADTSGQNVAVGERISYTVTYTISEGMSAAFIATDQLDAGLAFLSCDGITAAAALTSANGFSCDQAVFSAYPAGSTVDADQGRLMTLNFGNVTNYDTDNATDETVSITYTALVTNSSAASRGAVLGNHAAGQWISAGSSRTMQASAPGYIVVEPLLQTAKEASPTGGDAGDVITFTATVSNAAAANPTNTYNVVWTDSLPSGMTYVAGSLASVSGPLPASLDASAAPTLMAGWAVLAPGESAVITFQAMLNATVAPQQVVTNTQTVTSTSLPGDSALPISPYNPLSCERSGDSAACGGAENDYTASAMATVTIAGPSFVKDLGASSAAHTASSQVAIGEIVTYALGVTLPEGTTTTLHIEDTLPAGLIYLDGTAQLDLTGFAGTIAAPAVSAAGSLVTLDFGIITVSADNSPGNNRFSVLIDALVTNDATNQNGSVLSNSAVFQVDSLVPITPAPVTVTVVEPELEINKTASDDTPAFGQEITFTLHVAHLPTSTTDAFDLLVSDLIPTGLTYTPGSINAPAGWTTDDSAAPTLTFHGDLSLTQGSVDLTYRAHLASYPDVRLTDTLTNTAAVTWSSLPGSDTNERDGSGDVNDYSNQSSETVTVSGPDLDITKSDGGANSEPGLSVSYTLTYRNTGNAPAENVTVSEEVPTYTTFDVAGSDTDWNCTPDESAGSTCTLNLGTVAAGGSGSVIFSLIIDSSLPTTVVQISNTARIEDDGENGPDPTPENNSDTDTTPLAAVPDLVITKTDEVDVTAPDARLTYTLTIRNVGNQDATGVEVSDTLPVGVTFVSASNDGVETGGIITWPLFDLDAGRQVTRTVTVTVNDPYDGPTNRLTNTASLHDDGANGEDPTPENNEDDDTDSVATLDGNLSKTIAATNQPFTPDLDGAIGEIITYEVALTIPPGVIQNFSLSDTLERGLAFNECLSVTASSADLTSNAGAFSALCDSAVFSSFPAGSTNAEDQGRVMELDFGDLRNAGDTDAAITLRYTVVVLNNAANLRGLTLKNAIHWQWDGGELSRSAPPVTIVEPALGLTKKVKPQLVTPGGIVTFTLTVSHLPASNSDAFDVVLTDNIPSKLKYMLGTLKYVSGQAPTSLDDSAAPLLRVRWASFANNGQNSVIEFKARLGSVPPGSSILNTANVEWSSLPGSVRDPQSEENELSTERYYDPASPINVYGSAASAKIYTPDNLPETGFAPAVVTQLPVQPSEKRYQDLGDIWIEIPALDVKLSVVGVPAVEKGWDLSWLGNQVGYLEGTAFPSWDGNSVLTGHTYDANGQPGPFANLKNLKWGDHFLLHVYGQTYRYEVRQVLRQLNPEDLSPLKHDTYSWVTLLTCEGFQPESRSYQWRLAVRAVLVQIEK